MKLKKVWVKEILYYVVGNVIFNVIFSSSKTLFINKIGGKEAFIPNLCSSFQETFLFYTIVFGSLLLVDSLYKKSVIQQLNQKLKVTKERSEEDER